ncbi:MAG: SAM-dependent methyltransferase [Clostridia bacterium]|nr:SAM-dependent methyltransferase [Clostridia bacterium]
MKNNLSIRLNAVANLIKDNKIVADIGTDHASLPIFLVKEGRANKVYAADINKGPLESAKKNINDANLTDKIETILSDGLKTVPQDAEEIAIAGMGGKLIAEIIDAAPFTKSEKVGLILQPMSNASFLRRYLYENGYNILTEIAFEDAGHLYSALRAEYNGECIVPTEAQCRVGKLTNNFGEFERAYIEREIGKCEKKIDGMKKSSKENEEIEVEETIKNELENILRSF